MLKEVRRRMYVVIHNQDPVLIGQAMKATRDEMAAEGYEMRSEGLFGFALVLPDGEVQFMETSNGIMEIVYKECQ